MTSAAEERLIRAVGFKEIVALTVNGIIGAGIFALPATIAGILGAASPLAFAGAGIFMLMIVFCFAELGGRYDKTGGAYLYASEAFGGSAAFLVGWMYLLARVTSVAALSSALAGFVGFFFELVPPYRQAFPVGVLVVLGIINYLGIRSGTRVINFLTIAKMTPLIIFIAAGLAFCNWDVYRGVSFPPRASLSRALLLCMFAFSGFEVIAIPGAEMKDPRRDIPRGILLGSVITIAVYLLIQLIAVAAEPGLASSTRPLADAAQRIFGTGGGLLLTAGGVCSTVGTLTALLLVGPRILYAMSLEHQMPGFFSHIHNRYRSPDRALVIFVLTTATLTLLSDFTNLATLSAMARLVTYIGSALALLVLRARKSPEESFRAPGGPLLPIITVLLSIYLLSAATREQLTYGTGAIVVGLLIYGISRFRGQTPQP
jgi:amino acid transporter